ncbi:ankyrin repeat and SOCS box protein 1 isoform X2 [Chiroxiphia lanceolata]|uniref:ankyrin repeat and SOCS box protein 1 isoform X2 n=1 Tax=Chiroxiphia lanceolata TaxID=296741 RepID=UPI0013CE6BDB|nr:ankyrin repeat and SOCS box protein 1 isoform X2 [Chiroxiphia lanceolata]
MAEGGDPPPAPGSAGRNLKEWLREQFCDHPLEHCEDTRLHDAAFVGDLPTLRSLLQDESFQSRINEKSVWCCGWLPCTPLRIAATAGHGPCVDFLLQKGAEIDLVDVKGQTALYVAVVNGHLECAKILLEAGADPNGSRHHRSTPVYHAARVGRADILQELISASSCCSRPEPTRISTAAGPSTCRASPGAPRCACWTPSCATAATPPSSGSSWTLGQISAWSRWRPWEWNPREGSKSTLRLWRCSKKPGAAPGASCPCAVSLSGEPSANPAWISSISFQSQTPLNNFYSMNTLKGQLAASLDGLVCSVCGSRVPIPTLSPRSAHHSLLLGFFCPSRFKGQWFCVSLVSPGICWECA